MLTGNMATIIIQKQLQACIHTDQILNLGGIFYIIILCIGALLNSTDTVVCTMIKHKISFSKQNSRKR